MKLTRLGDCLNYGLTKQVPENEFRFEYFMSALLYLFFHGYVERRYAVRIYSMISNTYSLDVEPEENMEKILAILVTQISKKMEFATYEEMINGLNRSIIPRWIYNKCQWLCNMLEEICFIDSKVYYIEREDNRMMLCYLDTEYIDEENDDDERMEEASGFAEILGFNQEEGILYLRPSYISFAYVEYHVRTGEEIFNHQSCLGLMGKSVVVETKIETQNYLALKVGGKIIPLRPFTNLENYIIDGDELYVFPAFGMPKMFVPFRYNKKGEQLEFSYTIRKRYLLSQLQGEPRVASSIYERNSMFVDKTYLEEEKFTLKFLSEYFIQRCIENCSNAWSVCSFVTQIFSEYFDDTMDLMDYFYMLLEVSRRKEQLVRGEGISKTVFLQLERLETRDELKEYIYDLEKLREVLLEDCYWDDEKAENRGKKRFIDDRIGAFDFCDGQIETDEIPIIRGISIGNTLMMPQHSDKRGRVVYDFNSAKYYISYFRRLSSLEVELVQDAFCIENRPKKIIINCLEEE